MATEIVLVDDAKKDIALLPESIRQATIDWLTEELANKPEAAGTVLLGDLEGYRLLISPHKVHFIFVAPAKQNLAIVLLARWSEKAIAAKRAELIRRVLTAQEAKKQSSDKVKRILARLQTAPQSCT